MAYLEKESEYSNLLSNQLPLRTYKKEIVTSGCFKDELKVWSSMIIDHSKLSSNQEEADTRLFLHAIASEKKYIVVSSRDTKVFWYFWYHTITESIVMNFGCVQELKKILGIYLCMM